MLLPNSLARKSAACDKPAIHKGYVPGTPNVRSVTISRNIVSNTVSGAVRPPRTAYFPQTASESPRRNQIPTSRDSLRAMETEFFRAYARPEAWGDYGDLLQHGMTAHLPRTDGRLSLERTGPYIQPVTLPGVGSMVLTNAARLQLETSGLTGFSFRPIEKKLIVDLPWHTWDLSAEEPPEYPESGEPEDYILGKPHSPAVANSMGDLWEVVVPVNVIVVRPTPIVSSYEDLYVDRLTWDGSDLVRGTGFGSILFSKRAKDWSVEQWGSYLRFDRFAAR